MSDIYLAVEAAMTDDERAAFLDRIVGLNPHLAGGSVADFLEMLSDTDSDLAVVEQLLAADDYHPDKPLLGTVARALFHATGIVDANRMDALYEAAEVLQS